MNTMTIDPNNWQGIDASLEISLYEYNLLWRKSDKRSNTLQVIAKVGDKFGHTEIWESDLKDNWIDLEGIYDFTGMDKQQWHNQSMEQRFFDIVSYHGIHEFISYPRIDNIEFESSD